MSLRRSKPLLLILYAHFTRVGHITAVSTSIDPDWVFGFDWRLEMAEKDF
jgi:hypothetical protein